PGDEPAGIDEADHRPHFARGILDVALELRGHWHPFASAAYATLSSVTIVPWPRAQKKAPARTGAFLAQSFQPSALVRKDQRGLGRSAIVELDHRVRQQFLPAQGDRLEFVEV